MALTKVSTQMTQNNEVNVFDFMTAAEIADVKANTALVDVTAAVQSAIDAAGARTVCFPCGTYKITSTLTAINTSLVGESGIDIVELKYTATDGSACVAVNGYYDNGFYTTFKNITFLGEYTNGSATECTGLYLYNNTDEDVDAYVTNCEFQGFRKSIHIKGRGLTVRNSSFVVTLDAIYLDRVNPVNEGANPDQKTNSGARVYQFYNNRFHAMASGSIISNVEATNSSKQYLRGIHFADNYIDTTARIMNGPCRESSFIGNMHIYPSATQTLFFSNAGDWIDINICDNIFTSWRTVGGGATAVSNQRIMYQQDNISGLIFSNNNIYNVDEDVIEVGGNLTDGVITGNSFTNVILNASASAYRPVDIGGDAYRLQFNNNTIEVDGIPANADYIVNITGSATSVDCSNNAYNVSAFDELVNKGSYINVQRKIDFRNAAPTSGDWVRGDLIYNGSPSAGGTTGWVCVASGSPGTWKTFGIIAS
jgi:hypothetical protein